MQKKNILLIALAIIIYLLGRQQGGDGPAFIPSASDSSTTVHSAFLNKQSNLQIQGTGMVKRVLADDLQGLQHQKFILQTSPGQTVLVAHNIDVAERLPGLKEGDTVEFYGEYEWTKKGGVLHWTHHDPGGRHINGWLRYNGKTYQ